MATAADPGPFVSVTLKDLDFHDPIPERIITLSAENWQIKIGRGTQSGFEGLNPTRQNAWFDSRVMSRSHAVLRADPETRDISVEDVGSMHGTHLAGKRLKSHHIESLWPNDTLTLGADVMRGSAYFNALRLRVSWKWFNERPTADIPPPLHSLIYSNTFSANYSEDDHDDDHSSEILGDQEEDYPIYEVDGHMSEPDDEIQVIGASIRQPSIEVVLSQARTFTVPESDDGSTKGSTSPVSEVSDDESVVSSPLVISSVIEVEPTPKSKIVTLTTSRTQNLTTVTTDGALPGMSRSSATDPEIDLDAASDEGISEPDSLMECAWENGYAFEGDDDDDESEEEEADATNDPILDFGHPVQPSDQARAPSPSDAAMVKPSTDCISSLAPPFPPQPKMDIREPELVASYSRSNSAWAGHNSVLYDPVPRSGTSVEWAPMYTHATAYPPAYPASHTYQMSQMPSFGQPLPPLRLITAKQQPLEQPAASKKRKADDISSDNSNPGPAFSDVTNSDASHKPDLQPSAEDELDKIFANVRPNALTTVPTTENNSQSDENEEPARKKARKTNRKGNEKRGGHIVKMAAATITGVAIGAIGTIIGLAALPQDYFM